MKIFQQYDVYTAALDRIRYIFDRFPNVTVSISGGKDSTVTLDLVVKVATELGRLPVTAIFIDQEAEWRNVIEHMRTIRERPEVDLKWFQIPIRLFNATSHESNWLRCWDPDEKWMRDKEPGTIHENTFGTDRFSKLFDVIIAQLFPGQPVANFGGVRCEESPTRTVALTTAATFEHITYGKKLDESAGQYTFYPIYDWTYVDVWKTIHDYNLPYCPIYDYMYQHGYSVRDMRVSNLHHETALKHLLFVQEIEPDTWQELARRLDGVNTVKHLNRASMRIPKDLPRAFSSWKEYRDYLLENLITDNGQREIFRQKFKSMDDRYSEMRALVPMYRVQITALLVNDYHMTKVTNWENAPDVVAWRKFKNSGKLPPVKNKYIHGH